jgi:hypothetical protein
MLAFAPLHFTEMDSVTELAKAWGSPIAANFDAKRTVEQISSSVDAVAFVELCKQHPKLGEQALGTCAWELFDKVFSFSISGDHKQIGREREVVEYIFKHVRPREGYVMIAEKLFSTSDVSTFQLLCTAMVATLSRSDDMRLWTEGT